jgi:hypothetical protein
MKSVDRLVARASAWARVASNCSDALRQKLRPGIENPEYLERIERSRTGAFRLIFVGLRQVGAVNSRPGRPAVQTSTLRGAAAVTVAASLLALTACGGSSSNGEAKKKGPQVSKDSAAALKSAGSARFQGIETDGANSASIDLQLVSDGAVGTIKQSGLTINLVNTGGSSYVKAPAAFFTSQGAAAADAATVADKWVKLPASVTSFAEFTLNSLAAGLAKPTAGSTIEDAVTEGKVDGKSVVILKQNTGSQLFVAAKGPAYPLKLVSAGTTKATSTFTDFGKKVTVTAPAGAIPLAG